MTSLRIVVAGPFGTGNLGSEAILLSQIRGFSMRRPGSQCTVASFTPTVHRALGLDACDARDPRAVGQAISEADLLVVGGGELWRDDAGWNPGDLFAAEPSTMAAYARGPLAAAAAGIPYALFANGVGPLRTPAARRAVASLASLASAVSVRDSSSAEALRAAGYVGPLRLTADPAFSILPGAESLPPRRRPIRIGVVPRVWTHGVDASGLLHVVGHGVGSVARARGAEVVLLRFKRSVRAGDDDDDLAVYRVAESLLLEPDAIQIVDPSTPEEAAGWLGSCDAVVTMRLHGTILSAVAGVPSVGVAVAPKIEAAARQLGLSELTVPLPSCSRSLIRHALENALDSREPLRAGIEAGVDAARQLLNAAFDDALRCGEPAGVPARRPSGKARSHTSPAPCLALRLPRGIEEARQAARAASDLPASMIIAVGTADECAALQADSSVSGIAFATAGGGSFDDFLRVAADALDHHAPPAVDVIVIDALRFSPASAFAALDHAYADHAEAALIAARSARDADAAPSGAVCPDLGAARIRRTVWNETIQYLTGLETAAGCGAELARRARQQMAPVVSMALSATTAEDQAAIDRDVLRAPSFAPLYNRYHRPRPAARVAEVIREWVAGREVVVFPPTIGWTAPLAQRPHHLARAFARAGHAVVYADERTAADEGAPKEVAPGVLAVADAFSSLSFLDDPIVIVYAYNVECAAYFRRARVVYESIDDLSAFVGDHQRLLRSHRSAIERADVVTAAAAALWREATAVRPDTLYLPDGVHVADFDPRLAPEVLLPEADEAWFEADDRPVVIYWGAVAPWFDDGLVVDVARRRPDLRIAVLGPADARDLATLRAAAPANLRYFGPRPYQALATYARRASAALLPVSPGTITPATSPQLFEYLAARLPVVSTPRPDSGAIERVLLAGDAPSFSAALDQALALRRDGGFLSWVDAVVPRHDWSARAAAIRAALRIPGALAPAPLSVPADFSRAQDRRAAPAQPEHESPSELLSLQLARREETLHTHLARVVEKEQRIGELEEQLRQAAESARSLAEREPWLRRELARAHAEVQAMKDSKFWRLAKLVAALHYCLRALGFLLRHPIKGLTQHPPVWRIGADVREDLARMTPLPIKRAIRAVLRRRRARPFGNSRPSPATNTAPKRIHEAPGREWYESLRIRPGLEDEDLPAILSARPPAAARRRADVIGFPVFDWEWRYQRPQQILSRFAAHGHRVFYVSISRFESARATPRIVVRPIKDNVYEVCLAAERPPRVYGEVIDGENQEALLASLDELRRTFQIEEAVGYVMIPSWGSLALAARQRWGWRTIYDCMDEWEDFPGIHPALVEAEVRLVEDCDLLVVTAQRLYDKWRTYDRPTVLARNGVDYEFYAERCQPNVVLPEIRHPLVGYYGAIADWFDVELVASVARQRPNYTFVLLGGVFVDVSSLRTLPNIRLLGEQAYERMPEYLYHFDACIIPFKLNATTEATDPVKLYEYLSGGKPVVSVALPELEPYREYLYIAGDEADFVAKLDAALAEDDRDLVARRRQVARQHTWEDRYRRIEAGLAGATPKASIVIVTYNHLSVTTLCLESLIRNTEYSNYEVIVVDNDSIDGTQVYLRYLTSRYPHVKIVLNSTNEGFARANNQGIARSTGEYLVLLNNDTIVPPGWLSRLLRHLRAPAVGMVGPVTNAIANEAQIDVPYRIWSEMEAFAKAYTWAHDGQVADIHMLAMFCVALRRETYEKVGPLDEQFGIGMFEDDDYTLRLKQRGYRVVCAGDVFVHHFGKVTFKDLVNRGEHKALFEANQRRYEVKWNTQWAPHQHAPLRFEPLNVPAHNADAVRRRS